MQVHKIKLYNIFVISDSDIITDADVKCNIKGDTLFSKWYVNTIIN
jgi:hypothetical protein